MNIFEKKGKWLFFISFFVFFLLFLFFGGSALSYKIGEHYGKYLNRNESKQDSFVDTSTESPDFLNLNAGDPGPLSLEAEQTQRNNGNSNSSANQDGGLKWPPPSESVQGQYKKAAVATDNGLCSEIGRDVMMEGGNAVDAMIASFLCIGVVNPQSSGLGGGFLMTIYNITTKKCQTIDAREMAPLASNATMFQNSPNDSSIGYRSIGVPGELHGFWTVYSKFGSGKIKWKRIVEPAIKLARNGFPVSAHLAMVLKQKKEQINGNDAMKQVFINNQTGQPYEEGDIVKREKLADLLTNLANAQNPLKLFYKGKIAKQISAEFKENGGEIGFPDFEQYETIIHKNALESELSIAGEGELGMCGPPPPSSFAIVQAIISTMAEFYGEKVDLDDPQVYHRLIEIQKFAYAQRTKLGDSTFVQNSLEISKNMTKKEFAKWIASLVPDEAKPLEYYSLDLNGQVPDHGTSHVAVIDAQGNAVSATSSINQLLGSMRMSPTLGIIWNDSMDDFSSPNRNNSYGFAPSPENFIAPKKRPMSSMSPTIIYNKNKGTVKMAIGGSGGSRIISAISQTVIRALIFNQTIKESVDAPRFHNQFLPHVTEFERSIPHELIKHLVKQRHQNMTAVEKQISIVQALLVANDGFINANSDFRRKTASFPAGY